MHHCGLIINFFGHDYSITVRLATSQLRERWRWEEPTQQRPETGFDTVYITVKLNKTMNIWNISEMLIELWPITAKIRTCKLAHCYFWLSFPKRDWLFPCNTIAFQRYFLYCSSVISLSRPCKFSSIDFISYPPFLLILVPMQGLGTNATWVPKVELLT